MDLSFGPLTFYTEQLNLMKEFFSIVLEVELTCFDDEKQWLGHIANYEFRLAQSTLKISQLLSAVPLIVGHKRDYEELIQRYEFFCYRYNLTCKKSDNGIFDPDNRFWPIHIASLSLLNTTSHKLQRGQCSM